MKTMTMIAALLLAGSVMAQNVPSAPATYNASYGTAAFGMNAPGTNYGLIGNDLNADTWSFGYGASLSGAVTPAATWDAQPSFQVDGLLVLKNTQVGSGQGAFGIYASSTIPATSSFETLISSSITGNSIKLTSTPTISTTSVKVGTYLVLTSTVAAAIILQDEGTLSNSKLQLGASTRSVTQYSALTLIFGSDGYWREKSFSAN